MSKRNRIMYIEYKGDGLVGPTRIGRVTCSKTGCTLYYGGRAFQSLKGSGFKANYFDVATGEHYWISGPRKDGAEGPLAGCAFWPRSGSKLALVCRPAVIAAPFSLMGF